MEGANKIISFILGLVVVVVFFAVITGRLKLGNFRLPIAKGLSGTPTASITPEATTSPMKPVTKQTSYQPYQKITPKIGVSTKTIPNTGAPTLLLPLAFSALGSGIFLRKKS